MGSCGLLWWMGTEGWRQAQNIAVVPGFLYERRPFCVGKRGGKKTHTQGMGVVAWLVPVCIVAMVLVLAELVRRWFWKDKGGGGERRARAGSR